jgi:hypothetical protein
MARVTGPLMSVSASGTFAKTMVFSIWKGRPYVRERVIPDNPREPKQLGVRALFSFLSQIWTTIKVASGASWEDLAASKVISTFNAFMGENMSSWQNFVTPTASYPAANASAGLTETTMGLTGGLGMVTVVLTPSGATSIWGHLIFRGTAEITAPSWANCIAAVVANGANAVTYVDTPLEPGTYHYRSAVFNVDGVHGTVKADATAVAT